MAIFTSPFSKGRHDEKGSSSPPPLADDGVVGDTEEGVVDDVQDDLHRAMKPRQLSTFSPFASSSDRNADNGAIQT